MFSGIKVVYDLGKPQGQQIESIQVQCQNCTIPSYEPLQLDKYYRIALPSYISSGRSKLRMLRKNLKNIVKGPIDIDVFIYYLKHKSPISPKIEDRIVVRGSQKIIVRGENSEIM